MPRPVPLSVSGPFRDLQGNQVDRDLQGLQENKVYQDDRVSLEPAEPTASQGRGVSLERRARKDLLELEFRAPVDPRAPQGHRARVGLVLRGPLVALVTQGPLGDLGSQAQWDPQVLQDTVTKTPVWDIMLEYNCLPTSSKTTARRRWARRTIRTAIINPTTRHPSLWSPRTSRTILRTNQSTLRTQHCRQAGGGGTSRRH